MLHNSTMFWNHLWQSAQLIFYQCKVSYVIVSPGLCFLEIHCPLVLWDHVGYSTSIFVLNFHEFLISRENETLCND